MKHLQRFFQSDASGGIILILAAIMAMLLANTGMTSGLYRSFLETPRPAARRCVRDQQEHAVVD
ncbi:Na+/H+ antiporter NhaA type [Klebsiella michiganensis]|uniref:Na+/H+ antiporter NhaA type n=1 Tax=Klebsiella michiganensis TaxID=1134687 RepID=A0A7H4M0B0_9ENTR|nr:Na+/H+ antiporter NhaA type [Klebsiella michiganensis]